MCPWSRAMPGGLQHPSKDPQPLFLGAEESKVGEEAGSSRGAQDKSDVPAQRQGGHRSGHGPLIQGQPRCRRSPESWLRLHNVSSCSHRTGSPQGIQHQASSLGPKQPQLVPAWSQQVQSVGTGTRPMPGWLIHGHGASVYVVGNGFAQELEEASVLCLNWLLQPRHVTLILLLSPHPGTGASESSQGGDSRAPGSTGQGSLEDPSPSEALQPWPLTGGDTVSGSPLGPWLLLLGRGSTQGLQPSVLAAQRPQAVQASSALRQAGSQCQPCPSLEVQYALAKAQRQQLRAQHRLLLHRELGDGAAPGQEATEEVGMGRELITVGSRLSFPGSALPGQGRAAPGSRDAPELPCPHPCPLQWDTARWQQEVATLRLSLEAAQREREAAERDLEALLQRHRQERQACRQHLLQVGREGWGRTSRLPGPCQAAPGVPIGASGPAAPGRGAEGGAGPPAPGAAAGGAPGCRGARHTQPAAAGSQTAGLSRCRHTDTLSQHPRVVGTAARAGRQDGVPADPCHLNAPSLE